MSKIRGAQRNSQSPNFGMVSSICPAYVNTNDSTLEDSKIKTITQNLNIAHILCYSIEFYRIGSVNMINFIKLVKIGAVACIAIFAKTRLGTLDKTPVVSDRLQGKLPLGCSEFEIVRGSLANATRILLAEDHEIYSSGTRLNKKSIQCVEALTENDEQEHHIYLEAISAAVGDVDCSQLQFSLKPMRLCRGWDNQPAVIALREKMIREYDLIQFFIDGGGHEKEKSVKELHHERNEDLIKTLDSDKNEKALKIAILGRDHIIPRSNSWVKDVADSEYVRTELEKDKEQNPYVILAMK